MFDIKTFVTYEKEQVVANIEAIDFPSILRCHFDIIIINKGIKNFTTQLMIQSFSKVTQFYFAMKITIYLHNFPPYPTYAKKDGVLKDVKKVW